MKLGIAQIDTVPGDLARTTERVVACSHMAAERGAELLVFSLTTLSGPSAVPLVAQEAFFNDACTALEAIAGSVACDCAIPIVTVVDELPVVDMLLIMGGALRSLRSMNAGNDDQYDDGPTDLASFLPVLSYGSNRILFAFSYEELDYLGGPDDRGGYDVVVFVSGYGFAVNDASSCLGAALAEGRYRSDARASGAWFAAVGSVGGYGGQVFTGSSFVLSPAGMLTACAPAFEEDVIVADVGRDAVFLGSNGLRFDPYNEAYHLWQALLTGLAGYVRKSGCKGVSLIYDGTFSSRALACLACDALGPLQVSLYLHPAVSRGAREDAERLAKTLRLKVCDIPGVDTSGAHALQPDAPGMRVSEGDVAVAVQMMASSEEAHEVFLSARDKTAFALERMRLWDRVAQFAPLGDVYRSDILAMLQMRNTVSPVMDRVVLSLEDYPRLPVSLDPEVAYTLEDIDATLERHFEGEESFGRIRAESEGPAQVLVDGILATLAEHEPNRRVLPPCLIASTCTLAESRLPFGFAWRDQGNGRAHELFHRQEDEAADTSWKDAVQSPNQPPVPNGRSLREALDLIRDISIGSGADWRNPFSEN